jgi:hypothetical protein
MRCSSLLPLQSYLVVIAATATISRIVLNESDCAADEMRRSSDDLDHRIAQRTQELLAANAQLKQKSPNAGRRRRFGRRWNKKSYR